MPPTLDVLVLFMESMDNLQRRPSESNAMITRNRRCLSRLYLNLEVSSSHWKRHDIKL